MTLTRDTVVRALRPDLAANDQSLEVTAHKADGSVEVLLWIPKYRAEWPNTVCLQGACAVARRDCDFRNRDGHAPAASCAGDPDGLSVAGAGA